MYKKKKILVTGANGHLGQACVRDLKENGFEVRAAVRDLNDRKKLCGLTNLNVEIVYADLLEKGSLDLACEGCDGVFQLASVYQFCKPSDVENMVQTGTIGVKNILQASLKARVSRVIFTSSVVAIGATKKGSHPATEKNWNKDFSVPYFYQKTIGEQMAIDLAKEINLDVITICPGVILGPFFQKNTPSVDNIEAIAKGAMAFGVPDITLATVDVRDVATVHRLCFERGVRGERYLAVENNYSIHEIAKTIKSIGVEGKIGLKVLPRCIQPILPLFDFVNSKLFGYPRTISYALEKTLRGKDLIFDGSKSHEMLNWRPKIGLKESIAETLKVLRKNGKI